MNTRAPNRQTSAFTLIELMISVGLGAMILASAYVCLNAAISSRKIIEPRSEVFQNARVAIALITADLRSACPLSKDFEFLGMHRQVGDMDADNLDFATHNYSPARLNEGDFCEVSYFVDRDQATGTYSLWRRRNPTIAPDPLNGGRQEEIARGIQGVRFEYFDGYDWYDDWGEMKTEGKKSKADTSNREQYNLTGMPEAVRVTLWFDANPDRKVKTSDASGETLPETPAEPPLVFQSVARLNLAASANAAASANTGTNSAPDMSNQNNNPPPQ
jgi:hypothetical protein